MLRFIEKREQDIPGYGVKDQLQNLYDIYALYLLHKHLGDFLATGCINYTEVGGTSKRAAWKALRSGPAECSYVGGLHGPLPGFCSWAVRRQCVPYSVRGGMELWKDPLKEVPSPVAQAVAQAAQAMIDHDS